MDKLYFTSDTHFGHKNILHYTPKRCIDINIKCDKIEDKWVYTDLSTNTEISEEDAIKRMDCFIIDKWNSIIDKHDTVYILGDFSFYGVKDTQRIFHKLNGKKHLIIGNHDDSGTSIQGWTTCKQMNLLDCKESMFEFLNEVRQISPDLEIAGIAVTKVDTRKNYYKQTMETLHELEDIHVFEQIIRVDSSVEWSQDNSIPVVEYKRSSRSAKEYTKLAEEVMKLCQ